MVSIHGYQDFDICEFLQIETIEKKFFDQIIISEENIIVIKEFSNQEEIEEKWEDVMCFVAGHIQNKIPNSDLSENYMWNIYIVYLTTSVVDSYLKLNIEKNKFCCKKYVVNWKNYNTKSDALLNELPILADINFEVREDIYLKEDEEIKKMIIGSEIDPIMQYFITTDEIQKMNIDILINDMVGLYYEYSKEN